MVKQQWARWVAWTLVIIGLAGAVPVLAARYRLEAQNKRVDLVIDLTGARQLARQEGYPLERFLKELHGAGITAGAITELDVAALAAGGQAAVFEGADLLRDLTVSAEPDGWLRSLQAAGRLTGNHTYILPADLVAARRLHAGLVRRLGQERISWLQPHPAAPGLIEIDLPLKLLAEIGVGWDPADFALVAAAGLRPVPRPRNAPRYTAAGVQSALDEVAALAPAATSVLFFGKQVLGYRPDQPAVLAATGTWLKNKGWTLDLVEHAAQLGFIDQAGQFALAAAVDYRVARAYAMGQAEYEKYHPEINIDKMYRSALERNIRVLYLRPFFKWQEPGLSIIDTNLKYYRMLADKLAQYGHPAGDSGVFAPFFIPWWQKAWVGLAAVGAGGVWLGLVWPLRPRTLFGLLVLGVSAAGGLLWAAPNTGSQLMALGAAVLFPTLGGTLLLTRWRASAPAVSGAKLRPFLAGLAAAAILAGLGLAGGFAVAALLGDVNYLLEFSYFRGVKLELALPILLVALSYITMGRTGRPKPAVRAMIGDLRRQLDVNLKYSHIALGLIGLVGLFWYIQRSGNFPVVPVPNWERWLRDFLESTLVARPRFKEFMLGYPAVFFGQMAWHWGRRGWLLPLALIGLTAATSVVNSFSHLRTPWLLSLLRMAHGFWIGLAVAAAAGILITYGVRWLAPATETEAGS